MQGNYASARLRPVSGIMEDEDAADVAAGHGFSVVRRCALTMMGGEKGGASLTRGGESRYWCGLLYQSS